MFDVVVVGGGPAGMMAAGRAAELGAKVLLLEKNTTLGKKLLITGGGRSNVTNAEKDLRKLLSRFRGSDQFLFSPFSIFDNNEAIKFFNDRGMQTKEENEGRVFPVTNSAQSVLDVFTKYLETGKVAIKSNSKVKSFSTENEIIKGLQLQNGEVITGKSYILATGGMSRPETGSTGDGFKMLEEIGHKVIQPKASLVPVAITDPWVKKISGLTVQNIKIKVLQNNIKQNEVVGKLLFTHFGISGPTVLNLSSEIGELLKYGDVEVSLDLLPKEDFSTLNTKLQELFVLEGKKKLKNALSTLVPFALANVAISNSKIDEDRFCSSITKDERISLMKNLKDIRMKVESLLGEDKAIVTSGGVALEEVDFKTMQSRIYKNLYLVGDILNIDRPSGGYSLQICWTTGYVSGTEAAKS